MPKGEAVGDVVVEAAALHDVLLAEDVVADEARALALARQRADPVEFVVAAASVGVVLHVGPDPVGDLLQLELDFVRVG